MMTGEQKVERHSSAVYRTMLWLFTLLLLGGLHGSVALAGAERSADRSDIAWQSFDFLDGVWAVDRGIAVLPGDSENNNGVPAPDLAEAGGDSFLLAEAPLLRWSSHRLALGLQTHPAFADRPEAGASHARAPPLTMLCA
jgi:hypothetical protein